jgi:hypothetical protein
VIEERLKNEDIFINKKGHSIVYGTDIQLRHMDSGAYIQAEKTCAEIDKSSNKITLNNKGSKDCIFLIEPRYKYRKEGQEISYGDMVTFRSSKSNNMQLHVSDMDVLKPNKDYQDPGFEDAHKTIKLMEKGEGTDIYEPKNFLKVVSEKIDSRASPLHYTACYEVNCNN